MMIVLTGGETSSSGRRNQQSSALWLLSLSNHCVGPPFPAGATAEIFIHSKDSLMVIPGLPRTIKTATEKCTLQLLTGRGVGLRASIGIEQLLLAEEGPESGDRHRRI
jgi:hypothetical protein